MIDRKKTGILILTALLSSAIFSGCSFVIPAPTGSAVENPEQETAVQAGGPAADNTKDTAPDGSEAQGVGINLIPGADLSSVNSAWGIYKESGGSASFDVSGGKLTVRISDPGKVGHAVQLYCDGFELLEGGEYVFTADISSDVDRTIEWRVQQNGGDYHPYNRLEDVHIGPDEVTVTSSFSMDEASDPAPRMCFNLGDQNKEQGLGAHNVYIRNISLVLKDDSNAKKVEKMGELLDVNINQIGYRPNDEKRAVLRNIEANETFEVTDAASGETGFTGTAVKGNDRGSSGDTVYYADFSDVKDAGRYMIRTASQKQSYEFDIKDGVYTQALADSLRMLYLQRCGISLPEELAGDFAHRACHTEEAQVYGSNRYVEVSGGWHDAGDYGRYTVPAAKTVADLLMAYELYPGSFDDNGNIPESGNGIADILDEARYELEWLHKMQGSDGGVYHKVTGLNFDGFVASDECTEKLYLLPESKTATADFAGVMFMASRTYRSIDEGFADKCQKAADRALAAYIAHIDDRNYVNPSDVNTGEYADGISVDEFLWAVLEGYKTTGDNKYRKMLDLVDLSKIEGEGFGWANMIGYAYYAYLTCPHDISFGNLDERFYSMCDKLKDLALSGEAYGSTIEDDYPWGSNMTIANNGMALLIAHSMTGREEYRLAAKRQLDYLLGTNCNSYCFLTGYGTQYPIHPHHRPSQAVGKCMTGMLVGGPDSFLEDPYARATLTGLPKARCYVDSEQSYSCNEITIYWNSPLVFVLAAFK